MQLMARLALICVHFLSIVNFGVFAYCQGFTLLKSGVMNPYGAIFGAIVSAISFLYGRGALLFCGSLKEAD